jgi:predicted nucleotidyltransferase
MMNSQVVSRLLRENRMALDELGVKSLALFGSVARGEASPDSDVDLLVEFSVPVGLFEFVRLKLRLEQILGCEVDLVTPDALRPTMKDDILQEAVDVTP